ncbi:SurA N-terminal domain-containing protein [Psychrobium sp. 1_MG-2023]|uniref:SurA N-terminal domain-containing protein n=1 Tax=Psychrobium sp. 1_MG-2023 TaxID=3062624 RepID=UPI002734AFE4|nr:SurA N-terminal domain-containing protein [Psychrobium sp. 1_MG-2023]MDP2560574.1 SurA N-terminal domain-containing protein [Psychrobium sp. 1_MG-2023]
MLEKIRDGSQGVVAKAILGVVILSFALAGIGSYLGGSNEVAGAIVNGQKITAAQVEDEFQQERSRLEQQFGEMFKAIANDANYMASVRQGVLERLVAQELIEQTAHAMDLRVGDEEIKLAIRKMPEFQVDGQFDNDRYLMLIRRAGYRVEQFKEMLRVDMTRRQLMTSLISSDFTLDSEAKALAALEQQTRDIRFIEVAAADFINDVTVSDEQINDYYDLNSGQFMTQEQISLEFVELKVDALKSKVSIEADQVLAAYNENLSQYQSTPRRKVSHILVEFGDDETAAQATANDILARVQGGEDFATVAKASSDDTFSAEQGGDLDWIEPGVMDPSFDEAVFALSKGEVSSLVKTEFGFHVIKVTDAEEMTTKSFDDVKEGIEQELVDEAAKELFYELQQELVDVSFQVPENLDEAAVAIDAQVQHTELFARFGAPAVVNYPEVISVAFSDAVLSSASNSDVIEITPEHHMVIRLKQHNPSEVKSLADVTEQIKQRLVQEHSQELAKEKAQDYFASWSAGTVVDGVSVVEKSAVKRSERDIDNAIVTAAFKLAKATDTPQVELVKTVKGQAIVSLVAAHDVVATEQQVAEVVNRLNRLNADTTYKAFIDSLKATSDIQYPVQ